MKKICLLGSTGSIGEQTIDIIDKNKEDFILIGISCAKQIEKLEKIILSHDSIKYACVKEESDYLALKEKYKNVTFFFGDKGLLELIEYSNPNLVVNALVGFSGFIPSTFVISHDIDLALANKESLVVGGKIIKDLLKEHNA